MSQGGTSHSGLPQVTVEAMQSSERYSRVMSTFRHLGSGPAGPGTQAGGPGACGLRAHRDNGAQVKCHLYLSP